MAFGEAVRLTRITENISLSEMARRLGVSANYWSRVEREIERPPRDDLIEKSAEILGIRVDDLFIQAGRLPTDMQQDLANVVRMYRRVHPKTTRKS